jgi:signal transduction histidine kinase
MDLSRDLVRAQEEERKRISRELHDETGQGLMLLRMYVGELAGKSRRNPHTRQKLSEALALLDHTIEGLRRIIGRLSPRVLEELGLTAAIRKQARDLSRSAGMKAKVELPAASELLDEETELTVYRTIQEALHNVARHSRAKAFQVRLEYADGLVSLLVADDGAGFSQQRGGSSQTFGLAGMRDRIAALGGSLRIRSPKGKGTQVQATLPVARRKGKNILGRAGRNVAA